MKRTFRIIYLGKHDSGGNEDEAAVHYALEALGHRVERLREERGHLVHRLDGDFVLFHKWSQLHMLRHQSMRRPCVFWYFDLVDCPDPSLAKRCADRRSWMARTLRYAHLGFATDGDWVARDQTGKLVWLPQGADERKVGRRDCPEVHDVLLTAVASRAGMGRATFCEDALHRYGPRLHHISGGIHGEELAGLIAGSKIVLAPDAPATDQYCSNRLYLTLGFGGFLLHPNVEVARKAYEDGKEIVLYKHREDMHVKVARYLNDRDARISIAEAGLRRTMAEHLYRHRCEKLINTIRERLF